MPKVTEKAFSLDELQAFSGSDEIFRYPFSSLVFTQGIRYLVGRTYAHWLLTDIAYQHLPRVIASHPDTFYLVKLTVHVDSSATFCIEDGNDQVLYTHRYSYTDFPIREETLRLYACQCSEYDFCLMVPSEY